jgi:RimJ/RimL family protein N-acetyltransferase
LRELRDGDAAALVAALASEQVGRFLSTPPQTVDRFERFIAWTARERAAGRYICFAVVAPGEDNAVGLIQIRQLEPTFAVAEWGFALHPKHWGTGLLQAAARMAIDFAFMCVGIHRLEARSVVANGRGSGALRKLGATPEAVLRKSFQKNGEFVDQMLWAIVASEWRPSTQPRRIH